MGKCAGIWKQISGSSQIPQASSHTQQASWRPLYLRRRPCTLADIVRILLRALECGHHDGGSRQLGPFLVRLPSAPLLITALP